MQGAQGCVQGRTSDLIHTHNEVKNSFQMMCRALEGVSKGEQELHDSFKCMYVFKPYSDSDLSESDRIGSVVRFWQSYNPETL